MESRLDRQIHGGEFELTKAHATLVLTLPRRHVGPELLGALFGALDGR
jgi:hypothetical protein